MSVWWWLIPTYLLVHDIINSHNNSQFAYPLTDKLQAMAMPAPPTDILAGSLPTFRLAHRTRLSNNHTRVHFDIDTVKPCWAIVRMQGATVHRWSLGKTVTRVYDAQQGAWAHMLRFAGNHKAGRRLSMWVDVDDDAALSVQLTAKYLEETPVLQSFGAQFAEYVDVTGITVMHADWDVKVATGGVVRSSSAVPRVDVMHASVMHSNASVMHSNASAALFHHQEGYAAPRLCGAGMATFLA